MSLDPTVNIGQTVATSESREREMNSILEILGSRELLDRVVDEIGPAEILATGPAPAEQGEDLPDDQHARDRAVRELAKRITSELSKDSNVVNVSSRAADPHLAQKTLEVYRHYLKDG